jgi:hypothetical protein
MNIINCEYSIDINKIRCYIYWGVWEFRLINAWILNIKQYTKYGNFSLICLKKCKNEEKNKKNEKICWHKTY